LAGNVLPFIIKKDITGGMSMNVFDFEYCNVTYIEEDKAVLLNWKKFACFDDYRTPVTFALNLLSENPGSNLVVDARNGFEDDKADVEWAFTELIPQMAKTSCRFVCFIMNKVNDIEEEMDLWTKEFGKHFAVIRVTDYNDAIARMKKLLMMNVRYHVFPGKRMEFLNRVRELDIIKKSQAEQGNCLYEYSFPVDSEDDICLTELWTDEEVQEAHGNTEHFAQLKELKKEYVAGTEIAVYWVSEMLRMSY
jgi:quinol monooxygenase YgiN